MADIFVSYAREDIHFAKKLAKSLGRQGWSRYGGTGVLPLETDNSEEAGRIYEAIETNNSNQADMEPLETLASWIVAISLGDVLEYNEHKASHRFAKGDVIFMRHWISDWNQINRDATKGRIRITLLPRGAKDDRRKHAAALGGWLLAIDKRAPDPNKDAAVRLVNYLSSADVQKSRFINYNHIPTTDKALGERTGNYAENVRSIIGELLAHKEDKEIVIAVRRGGKSESEPFRSVVWGLLDMVRTAPEKKASPEP